MSVVLAIMAKAPEEAVKRAVASALDLVDKIVLVVAPDDPLRAITLPKPWRVVEEPWAGHAATRTLTYRHARADADWVLMLDAHDVVLPGARLPAHRSTVDCFSVPIDMRFPGGRWRWFRHGHLMRGCLGAEPALDFAWEGPAGLHEVLRIPPGAKAERWPWLSIRPRTGVDAPSRAASRDYAKDAEALQGAFSRDGDPRTAFYLAWSLKDAGKWAEAQAAFEARVAMPSPSRGETLWAHLYAAKLALAAGLPRDKAHSLYQRAVDFAPERAETWRELAAFLFGHDEEGSRRAFARSRQCRYPTEEPHFVNTCAYSSEALSEAGIDPDG